MKKEVKNKEKVVSKKENNSRKKYVAEKNINKDKKRKENIFKRIVKYFKGVLKEVKRIRWTTGKDLVKYSVSTIVFVLFFGIYFYGIDWLVLLVRSLAK